MAIDLENTKMMVIFDKDKTHKTELEDLRVPVET